MSSEETVSTKFLIISDTHNFNFGDAEKVNGQFRLPVPKVDVVLHCGDLTVSGGVSSYKNAIKMLSQIDADVRIVIAGNHDLDLDEQYCKSHFDEEDGDPDEYKKAITAIDGQAAMEAGVTYLKEGLYIFPLKNGAMFRIFASPYQPEFCDFAFPYERNEDRFNPTEHVTPGTKCIAKPAVPSFPGIDIMMTHGPPEGILDKTFDGQIVGCRALMRAVSRVRPLLHCFGHIHEASGAKVVTWRDDKSTMGEEAIESQKDFANGYPESGSYPLNFGKETLMVNAAIMNLQGHPANSPWIVELELPPLSVKLPEGEI